MWLFLTIGSVYKEIKSKKKIPDNDGHNILRLFDILPKFSVITSEMKRNY